MAHEITPPSTAEQAQIFFTNDAQTLLEVVCPANPLPVTVGSGGITAEVTSVASVAAPTYSEGIAEPFSQTLEGDQRVIAKQSGTWTVTASQPTSTTFTATQVTVPATANGILVIASNASRKGATISNPGPLTVYIQQGATGVTTSNGFGIPAGSSYNIDSPIYTGALYGIISTGTQVVTVSELT